MGWPSGVLHPLQDEGLEDGGCPTQGDTTASLAFSMRRRRRQGMSLVLVAAAWQTLWVCSRQGQLRDRGLCSCCHLSPGPCWGGGREVAAARGA